MNILKRIINKFRKNQSLKWLQLGQNTTLQYLNLEVRKPVLGKKFLKIGNNSVVGGRFVFENENGLITIGENTFIGSGLFVSINSISIGNNVMVSWDCTFIDNDAHSLISAERKTDVKDWKRGLDEGSPGKYKNWGQIESAPITILDDAWIGFNVILLKGITIGKGAVVGAGSVVTKDVPDYAIVAGNPAKIVRYTT